MQRSQAFIKAKGSIFLLVKKGGYNQRSRYFIITYCEVKDDDLFVYRKFI